MFRPAVFCLIGNDTENSIDKNEMKENKKIEDLGMYKLPICISKTQFSLYDD